MDDRQSAFVEGVGQMLAGQGLPRTAGRIWAWLLICDPPEQTAAALAEQLHASRGTVSDMIRLLENAGLVKRSGRSGDRREYFSIPPGATRTILYARLPGVTAARQLMDEGLQLLSDRPEQARARLQEVRDIYAFFERELPRLIERFEKGSQET